MRFEGEYLRGAPTQRAIREAQEVQRAFLSSPEGQSVRPRPVNTTMAVLDFSRGCRSPRGLILGDSERRAFLVAHGSGQDAVRVPREDELPRDMSNGHGTHLSSAGLYIAKSIVPSAFGERLRMFGVCTRLNTNADARWIGMHPYSERFFLKFSDQRYAGIGESHGCPAVSEFVWDRIKNRLDGGFIYIYHPDHRPRGFTSRPAQSRHSSHPTVY